MNTARHEVLTAADRGRLAHILGRLGSEFESERAAAGLLATKLLRGRGLTWDDLLGDPPAPKPPPEDWRKRAAWCGERPELLTPWERAFLDNLADRLKLPTPKQAAIIERLVARRMAAGGDR